MGKGLVAREYDMNILITGADGFLGKNFKMELYNIAGGKDISFAMDRDITILECNSNTTDELLKDYCAKADIIYHFAAVNRTPNKEDFEVVNIGFTQKLIDYLELNDKHYRIIFASSLQATLEGRFAGSEYGKSKKIAEEILKQYSSRTKNEVIIYRFPGIFGKWCKPNYNSVVATFCYNISHDLKIIVNDASTKIELVYIDDVINEMVLALKNEEHIIDSNQEDADWKYCQVPQSYMVNIGELADIIYGFKKLRSDLALPDVGNPFIRKMWATYLSYLPEDDFSYPLKMNVDSRGSFTEIFKTISQGQVSVNISKPGITKGQHWHHSKNEKFVVVAGKALIQFRKVGLDEEGNKYPVIDYHVSGEKIEVVDIPTGYTHNIINEGETDLVTVMWASEIFNPNKPDTFGEVV